MVNEIGFTENLCIQITNLFLYKLRIGFIFLNVEIKTV